MLAILVVLLYGAHRCYAFFPLRLPPAPYADFCATYLPPIESTRTRRLHVIIAWTRCILFTLDSRVSN